MNDIKEWIFTWGYGQMFPNKYIIIRGTYNSAREVMCEMYGTKWAFQYPIEKQQDLKDVGIYPLHEGVIKYE